MGKSNEMPEPQVLDYNSYYRVTPLFVNDLKIVFNNGNVAYCDAKEMFDVITEHKGILPAAILNEFIRKLGSFPYKVVASIMAVIDKHENFCKYFEQVELKKEENQKNEASV